MPAQDAPLLLRAMDPHQEVPFTKDVLAIEHAVFVLSSIVGVADCVRAVAWDGGNNVPLSTSSTYILLVDLAQIFVLKK